MSKAVIELQQTDPTSWTSQAGLVKVEVAAGKLVKQPGGKLARSKPATVKRGEECKPFYTPDLRTVPGVAVRHSEVTPKPHDEQAIAGGVAQFNESSIVIHCNWLHGMLDVAWQTLLTDSGAAVFWQAIHRAACNTS